MIPGVFRIISTCFIAAPRYYLPKMGLSAAAQRREQVLGCVGRLTYDYGPLSGIKALRDLVVDIHLRHWPDDPCRQADANCTLCSAGRAQYMAAPAARAFPGAAAVVYSS
jgi:hypothetical protein